jgi:DNA polymerase epsilon subunit 1
MRYVRSREAVTRPDAFTRVQTTLKDPDWPSGKAAVDYYFIQDDGSLFKSTLLYEPYFVIACKVCVSLLLYLIFLTVS